MFRCAAGEPLVAVEKKAGAVAVVTLNRTKALNALNIPFAQEIVSKLQALDADNDVNCIVLTGSGRSFVAGADIKMMAPTKFADWQTKDLFADLVKIRSIQKPIIAAVNGFAFGGGCELAMMCDMIVASDKATFGQPEIKLGTIPGLGGTIRLTQLIGKAKAMEWVLTGQTYTADQAERAGLVSRVVEHDKLLPEAIKLAETIAGYSRLTTSLAKDCVNKALEVGLTEGLAYEKRSFNATFATEDQKEGMSAFVEKRKASFKHQ